MSREVDDIIGFFRASGMDGVVTDISTPGVHTAWEPPKTYGDHYRPATASPSGRIGAAVDFAHRKGDGRSNTPELLAIARFWEAHVGASGKLNALYYSGLEKCVHNGRYCRWTDLPKSTRDAIRKTHWNHVHVALKVGARLVWSAPPLHAPPVPAPPPTKETAFMIATEPIGSVDSPVEYPDAAESGWVIGARGHVYSFGGAPWLGGWDDATRNGDRRCVALVPTLTGHGYWLVSNRGEVYAYGDAPWFPGYQAKWGPGVIIGALRNKLVPVTGGVTVIRDDGVNLNRYGLPV